jgi:hypothetical protein
MSNRHPIVPSPEQVDQWFDDAVRLNSTPEYQFKNKYYIATQAAQWGADLELEACCEWLAYHAAWSFALRAARRPKPPSLKEQALEVLNITQKGYGLAQVDLDTIRKALEALPND